MRTLLKFGLGNAKLGKRIHTFSLPAGHSCPGASACLAKADRATGRITDGGKQEFRCFAASMEWRAGVRAARWHNFNLLKSLTQSEMRDLILASLPKWAKLVRVHVSGDYFSSAYFGAWMAVASARPEITFYSYTKSINFWVDNLGQIPANFRLTASFGGKYDALIEEHGLKNAQVVFTIEEAMVFGLAIDHDDSHAYDSRESFALLIHGMQQAGSKAGAAVRDLKGVGSYSKEAAV
jgi:protein gp88